jgi:hypothetical protein
MTTTVLGPVDPDSVIDNTGIPDMPFSPFINARMLEECYRLSNSNWIVFRAQAIKLAILFHRIDPVMNINGSAETTETKDKLASDPFRDAFAVTWGKDNEPVDDEFKAYIGDFMMDAVLSDDAWGFVPWTRRKVYSQERQKVFEVPVVPQFGLWRVKQQILSGSKMDVVFQLEPISPSSGASGALGDPVNGTAKQYDELGRRALAQVGGSWTELEKEARRRIKSGESLREGLVSTSSVSNRAQDAKASPGKKRQKFGLFVFSRTRPMLDGTVRSAAATTLSINETVAHRIACSKTAIGISSNPTLVTQRTNAGAERQGFTAAQAVVRSGDAARTKIMHEVQADAAAYMTGKLHDQTRAQDMQSSAAAMATQYDPMTGRKRLLINRPFFDRNRYDLQAGQQVASQPMPVAPSDVQQMLEHSEEATAAAYGVTRSMAIGETSSVKAGAEINQDVARKVIDVQGARIAAMTEWLLNHLFHDIDTGELQQMVAMLDEVDPEGKHYYNERKRAIEEIGNTHRFRVRFAATPPPLEQVQAIALRGLMSRETEGALSMASIGMSPHLAELQKFPDPTSLEQAMQLDPPALAKPKAPPAKSKKAS